MEANKIEYDLKAPQTEDVVLPDGEMTDEEKAEFWENEVDIPVIEQTTDDEDLATDTGV